MPTTDDPAELLRAFFLHSWPSSLVWGFVALSR